MRQKVLRKIIFYIILLTFIILSKPSFADVGSFESYDSGSSSSWGGSSSWDSGSSWDWDNDYSYSSGGYSGPIILGGGGWYLVIIIIIAIAISISKSKRRSHHNHINYNYTPQSNTDYNDDLVSNKIRQIDNNFNEEDFKGFAREVFIKLQNAWTDRDWEKIRPFESTELYEQHKEQLEGYIRNNQINVMERICVNWVHLLSFEQSGGKDILKVDLNSRMGDYIIDATTKKVLKGDKTKEYYHTYTLTFIRKTGTLTTIGDTKLNTTNCPNCGAPTEITSSGRCLYCNSIITTEDHGWVLSNLTRKN